MPSNAIFRSDSRFVNAANFVQQYRTNNSGTGVATNDNQLYAAIGRENNPQGVNQAGSTYAVSAGIWVDENAPPLVLNTVDEAKDFYCTAIGAQKVNPLDITLVIPRRDWTTATAYTVINEASATWYNGNFYVVTDLNEVWICVVAGGGNSTVKPVRSGGLTADNIYYNDGRTSIFTGADGYSWKYLYTLVTYQIQNLLETLWLPVPIGNSLWTPAGDPQRTQGRDDAHALLGCRNVMIRSFLDAGNAGSGKLPSGLRFRQYGLISNPVVLATGIRATASVYYQRNTINGAVTDQLRKYDGSVVYIENRSPLLRENSQAEEFRTVLAF